MANNLYFPYSPSFSTSNTKRMTSIKAISPDNLNLFASDKIAENKQSDFQLFDDPNISGDNTEQSQDDNQILESMSYTPDIGNVGNTFGKDKAGSNIGDDGRMEYYSNSIVDDVPEIPLIKAQRVTSLITGPEEDELDDSDVLDSQLFEMYQMMESAFTESYLNDYLNESATGSVTYAIPRLKRYPLTSKKGILYAVKRFDSISNPKDKQIMADNIIAAAERLDIDLKVDKNNSLYNYVPDSMRKIPLSESVSLDAIDEGVINSAKLTSEWMRSTNVKNKKIATLQSVDAKEYKRIKNLVKRMREVEKYEDYYKLFVRFCKIFHIPYEGTIICDHIEKKNKLGTYTLSITWSNNTNKITIPEGYKLYHISPVAGIKELIPQFRGKPSKGYMYDKPRIYFSIKKHMPKFNADLVGKDAVKTHQYVAKTDIREVYVDPIVWAPFYGAVYIETTKPVPVEEINKQTVKNESIFDFILKNDLAICDDSDVMNEGILNVAARTLKRFKDEAELKAFWNRKQALFRSGVWDDLEVDEKEYNNYKKMYQKMCDPNVKYREYKKYFTVFCKLFSVYPDSTILENFRFYTDKKSGKYKIACKYSTGMVKCILPNDIELRHVSPASNITKLVPTFKSKTQGKYFYPNPRVYFTLKKNIAPTKAGLENKTLYQYTPKEKITTVYIDPTYTKFSDGAVFVPTTSPIEVIEREDRSKWKIK